MIRKLTEQDRTEVLEYLYQEPSLNIFLIGDIENYGFDVDFQDVYGEFIDGKYQSVVLRYKENCLYYSHEISFNEDWLEIIRGMDAEFLSGRKLLTDLLMPYFPEYKEKPMYFCEVNEFNHIDQLDEEGIIDVQTEEDCDMLFGLLKTIEEFDSMKKEKRDDFVDGKLKSIVHSKAYYIKEDGVCASTVSTVADTTTSAMVVAVATLPQYRGKGYASKLMIKLLHEYLVVRKKSLCLFYDNPKAGAIYHRLGFVDKDMWVMLVRK